MQDTKVARQRECEMTDTYSAQADSFGSWQDAITAIREQHRKSVKTILPELRRRRYQRRMPRRVIARMIGVTESSVRKWETELRVPAPDLFSRWRDLLGL
jgi:DNA-binding transcriptional regulator YiaG